jgi:LPXTG-site transpeptidase (sortase) family protein
MRTRIPALAATAFLAAVLMVAAALPAAGYIKQPQARLFLSAPNVVKCDRSATITGKVIDVKTGKPVSNQIVSWRLIGRQSGSDRLSSSSTKTNRAGVTSVSLRFGPKAGPRKVAASIRTSKPVITVRCAGGLPKTSVLPPDDFIEQAPAALLEPAVAPPPPTTGLAATLPMATIRVDRLGIDLPVVEGDGYRVPDLAAAHYPGTAWPGQGSNTYLYAHARTGHFLELWQVRTGDLVEMDMADGTTVDYQVSEIHPLVPWDALEYLAPTDGETLTLQTCLSYEDTAPRFVVIATRVPSA